MKAFKTITNFNEGIQNWLSKLPIKKGEKVEIIIIQEDLPGNGKNDFPLKNTVEKFLNPFNDVG